MSNEPIIMVSGSKGGVGKSLVCMTVLDFLGPSATLIETDTSNPDVAKAYKAVNAIHALDLDNRLGWIDLVNLAENLTGPIVINGAARSVGGLQYATLLSSALAELERELIVLFVMSRTRDSLELLADHREVLPAHVAKTYAVLNKFFGQPDEFQRYAESNQKKEIEAKAGTLVFPDLADRVHDQLINERLTIADAERDMRIGSRVELLRWRNDARAELRKALE